MPVKKNRPSYETASREWIAPIVTELNSDQETGQPEAPTILEDYQAFSDRFSVRVVWSKWESVPPADRVPIILEAYRQSKRAEESPNITSARGLTPTEAKAEEAMASFGPTADIIRKAARTVFPFT
jgi:hypothetical protein